MTDKINKYAEFMSKQIKEGSFGYPSKSGKQGVGVDARGPVEDAAVSLDEAKKVPGGSKHLPESEEVKFSDYVAWIAEGDEYVVSHASGNISHTTTNPKEKLKPGQTIKKREGKLQTGTGSSSFNKKVQ